MKEYSFMVGSRTWQTRESYDSSKRLFPQNRQLLLNCEGYKVQPKSSFKLGKVFKILWAEPAGSDGHEIVNTVRISSTEYQYFKIRRFLVLKQMERHCNCLLVLLTRESILR